MKNKMFTLTAALIAVFGLSLFVAAQSRTNGEKIKVMPNPKVATFLKCETKAKEMNNVIMVTNSTNTTMKKGQKVLYSIGAGAKGDFTLTKDLAPNTTLTADSVSYGGNQGCKAWF